MCPILATGCRKSRQPVWTGEQAPPPGAAPQIFNLSRGSFAQRRNRRILRILRLLPPPTTICLSFPSENSGRKLCKEDIFLPGNGISLQKNIANPTHLSPDLILRAVLRSFFDKLPPPASGVDFFNPGLYNGGRTAATALPGRAARGRFLWSGLPARRIPSCVRCGS